MGRPDNRGVVVRVDSIYEVQDIFNGCAAVTVFRPQHTVDPNYEASDHDQRLSHRGPQFVCDVNLRFVRRVYLERPELLLVRLHDVPLDLV